MLALLPLLYSLHIVFADPSQPLSKSNLDFSNWDNVLQLLVTPGNYSGISLTTFNYSGLEGNQFFAEFTNQVEAANLTNFNQNEFTAFWLNVYNYLAVRTVFQNPCAQDLFGSCAPLKSIQQIGEQQPSFLLNTVWSLPTLHITSLGKIISLDDIQEYLRRPFNTNPNWKENPKVLGCLACSGVSCPNLRARAYQVATIDQDVEQNLREFLQNPKKGALVSGTILKVSPIFNWYSEDFNNQTGPKANKTQSISLEWFLEEYGPEPSIKQYFKAFPNGKIAWFAFDWNLNGEVDSLCSANRMCFPWWGLVATGIGCLILIFTIAVCIRMNRVANINDGYEVVVN